MAMRNWRVHRVRVRDLVEIAFWREGVGGYPLLLVHGYPETKRIFARNVEPLARAGFEVIVPDLRGFGDSGPAADGFYDPAAYARDLHALVHDVLGHERCAAAGGDVGSVVVPDLSARFPGFVERQCIWNGVAPMLGEVYERAGIPADPPLSTRAQSDYFLRQGGDPEGLLAELDTPARRRAYIADFYGHRLWAAPGAFTREDVDWMTEPFADAATLRTSFAIYEVAFGRRPTSEPALLLEPNTTPTLLLYGPEDAVVSPSFPRRCELAFPEHVGAFVVPGAGHFLPWERAELFNQALRYVLHPGGGG
jgi:pimeloyl-ACP methyl ester carboxylesterase